MDFFLIHCLILAWASLLTARRLYADAIERLLAAAILAWANLVATCLLLSPLHRLGEATWFMGVSTLLALLAGISGVISPAIPKETPAPGPRPGLQALLGLSLAGLALGSVIAACGYAPSNPESLSFQLPRAMLYLGQGSLAPFETADARQVCLPFNDSLLRLSALVYGAPSACLALFNALAWIVGGLGIYRLCRLNQLEADASLGAAWLCLALTPALAQAASTTPDLVVATAMVAAAVFFLRWRTSRRRRDAGLCALAAGLAAGSSLGALFFLIVVGAVVLAQGFRSASPDRQRVLLTGCLAAVPAAFLALAFLFHRPGSGLALPRIPAAPGSLWPGFMPLWQPPPLLGELSEDGLSLGPAGALLLVCAGLAWMKPFRAVRGWSVAGLGGLVAMLLSQPTPPAHTREWVPALWLLAPCLAAVIQAAPFQAGGLRRAAGLLLVATGLVTAWSAGIFLLHNTSRPLLPLLSDGTDAPSIPRLPLRLVHRLSAEPRVDFDTDATSERIFPLMALRPGQRWTSRHAGGAGPYQLVSRATGGRSTTAPDLPADATHVLLTLRDKRSAGVEFLAALGGARARDYFGLPADAGASEAQESNRHVLFLLDASVRRRLRLVGLSPADGVRIAIHLEAPDGTLAPLGELAEDGVIDIPQPFRRLTFAAFDSAGTPVELGKALDPPVATGSDTTDNLTPSSPLSLFATELVQPGGSGPVTTDGLLPAEGPFPQWELPRIRWVTRPTARIIIPATPQLARLRLAFAVRLHSRKAAELEVRLNGSRVQSYHIDSQLEWLEAALELSPGPGENIIELRDLPLTEQPDWLEYLERYPDVRQHVLAHNLALEEGAREHYEVSGKAEGRTIKLKPAPKQADLTYYFMFRSIQLEGFRAP